jgi:beta-glucanase (GH16 family)
MKNLLIVFSMVLAIVSCKEQEKTYQLVWADEFDYDGLPDDSKWDYEVGFIRNKEAQYYTHKRLENTRVENGMLVIESKKEDYKEAKYTSGSINTWKKAGWKYGKIEVRAKIPTGKGSWPAIWMMGTDRDKVGWPRCGEIDIMENVGKEPNRVYGTVHTPHSVKNKKIDYIKGAHVDVENLPAEFHTYGIEWSETKIDFFFDGKKYLTYTKVDDPEKWPFDKEMYLLLNTAVGGAWGGEIDDSIFPLKYYIDYVRVYQKK